MEKLVIVKKRGKALWIDFPTEIIEKEQIKSGDKVFLSARRIPKIKELFGSIKSKRSTQEIMDEIKRGWE